MTGPFVHIQTNKEIKSWNEFKQIECASSWIFENRKYNFVACNNVFKVLLPKGFQQTGTTSDLLKRQTTRGQWQRAEPHCIHRLSKDKNCKLAGARSLICVTLSLLSAILHNIASVKLTFNPSRVEELERVKCIIEFLHFTAQVSCCLWETQQGVKEELGGSHLFFPPKELWKKLIPIEMRLNEKKKMLGS